MLEIVYFSSFNIAIGGKTGKTAVLPGPPPCWQKTDSNTSHEFIVVKGVQLEEHVSFLPSHVKKNERENLQFQL